MVMATEAYEINKFKTGHPVYGCSGRDTKCLCSIGLNYKKIKEKLDRNLLPNSIWIPKLKLKPWITHIWEFDLSPKNTNDM